jgi:hypothetical protein
MERDRVLRQRVEALLMKESEREEAQRVGEEVHPTAPEEPSATDATPAKPRQLTDTTRAGPNEEGHRDA